MHGEHQYYDTRPQDHTSGVAIVEYYCCANRFLYTWSILPLHKVPCIACHFEPIVDHVIRISLALDKEVAPIVLHRLTNR